jgi:hypothetical protein
MRWTKSPVKTTHNKPNHQCPNECDGEIAEEAGDSDRQRDRPVPRSPQVFQQHDVQQAGDRQ